MRRRQESRDCSVWRRKAQGGLNLLYKYLMKDGKEDKDRLFSVMPSDRTRGNGTY